MLQNRVGTAELVEETCNEFFSSNSDLNRVKKNQSHSNTTQQTSKVKITPKLTPLVLKENERNDTPKKTKESDTNSESEIKHFTFTPSRKKSISLILQDHHYISTLQHKAAGVSGLTPKERILFNDMLKAKKDRDEEDEEDDENLNNNIDEDLNDDDLGEDSLDNDLEDELEDDDNDNNNNYVPFNNKSNQQSSSSKKQDEESELGGAFSVEFMQLQSIQNSKELVNLIKALIKNYSDFSNLLKSNANINTTTNKKIISNYNDNYVIIYEDLLCILMKLYRKKIKKILSKNSSKYIKKIKYLNKKLENPDHIYEIESLKLKNQLLESENEKLLLQVKELKTHKTELNFQNEKLQHEISLLNKNIKKLDLALEQEKNKNHELNVEKFNKINEKSFVKEKSNNKSQKSIIMDHEEEDTPEKSFIDLKSKSKFKYPLVTSSTQTEVDSESCLWDIQNGWSLPINLTSNIRRMWRDSINFASCKFCRGVGFYALKTYLEITKMANSNSNSLNFYLISDSVVINHENYIGYLLRGGFYNNKKYKKKVLLRQNLQKQLELLKENQEILPEIYNDIQYGSIPGTTTRAGTLESSSSNNFSEYSYPIISNSLKQAQSSSNNLRISDLRVTSSSHSLWTYPPELINFLSNLPQSIQALNPLSKKWVIENCYLLFHYKILIDYEDSFLQNEIYKTPSASNFGSSSNNLLDFIIEIYLRSYESRRDAEVRLYVFIKSLKEYYISNPLLVLFTKSLQIMNRYKFVSKKDRKKENDKKQIKGQSSTSSNHSHPNPESNSVPTKETIFNIYEDPISKEMLSIVLFVRQLLLFPKYNGVYKKQIEEAHASRAQSSIFNQFQQDLYVISKKLFSFYSIRKIPINTQNGDHSDQDFEIHDKYNNKLLSPHVILDFKNNIQHFYLPLDRCIRILKPFLIGIPYEERLSIYRFIETKTRIMNPDGSISIPEGMLIFIRSTMRLFIYSNNFNAVDISSWEIIRDTYSHNMSQYQEEYRGEYRGEEYESEGTTASGYKEYLKQMKVSPGEIDFFDKVKDEEEEINKKNFERDEEDNDLSGNEDLQEDIFKKRNNDINKEKEKDILGNPSQSVVFNSEAGSRIRLSEDVYKYTLVCNLDFILLIISEILQKKSLDIEKNLIKIFEDGDVNGDNVLSFYEFQSIIHKIVPNYSTRKIMSMFRQALLSNTNENSNCINANQFVNICKDYSLFQLWDLNELKLNYYKDILPDFMKKQIQNTENEVSKASFSLGVPPKSSGGPKKKKSISLDSNASNHSTPLNTSRNHESFEIHHKDQPNTTSSIPTLPSVFPNHETTPKHTKSLLRKSLGVASTGSTVNNSPNSSNPSSPIGSPISTPTKKVSFTFQKSLESSPNSNLHTPPPVSSTKDGFDTTDPPAAPPINLHFANNISSSDNKIISTNSTFSSTIPTSKISVSSHSNQDHHHSMYSSKSASALLKGSFKLEKDKEIEEQSTLTSSASTSSIPSAISIPSTTTPSISSFTLNSTRSIFSKKLKSSKHVDANSIANSVSNLIDSLKNSTRSSFEMMRSYDAEEDDFGFKNYESIKVEDPEEKKKREEKERIEKERIEREEKERLEYEEMERLEREEYLKKELERKEKRKRHKEMLEKQQEEEEKNNNLRLSLESKILNDIESDINSPFSSDLVVPLTPPRAVPTLESLLRAAELSFEGNLDTKSKSNKSQGKEKIKTDFFSDPFSIYGTTLINSHEHNITTLRSLNPLDSNHSIKLNVSETPSYRLEESPENTNKFSEISDFQDKVNGVNIFPSDDEDEGKDKKRKVKQNLIYDDEIAGSNSSKSHNLPPNINNTQIPNQNINSEEGNSARSLVSSSRLSQKLMNNLATSSYYEELDTSKHIKPEGGIARIKIDESLSKKSSKKILEELKLRKLRREKEKLKQYEEKKENNEEENDIKEEN